MSYQNELEEIARFVRKYYPNEEKVIVKIIVPVKKPIPWFFNKVITHVIKFF
jgi:hypothetical protein